MKFSIKDFFSKYDQIRRKLRIQSHLLKKSLNGKLHLLPNGDNIIHEVNNYLPNLPPYKEAKSLTPTSVTNNKLREKFEHLIMWLITTKSFEEKKLFMLPSGKTAKKFITKLIFWLTQFNRDTKLYSITLKAPCLF